MKYTIFFFLLILAQNHLQATTGFRENCGQIKNQNGQQATAVRFFLQCNGFNVQIRDNGFSYDFIRKHGKETVINRVDFVFENLNPNFSVKKSVPTQPYKKSFVSDNGAIQYEKITFSDFYPGIDLVFKRKGKDLFEYDFEISQYGNIEDITFNISGADIHAVEATEIYLGNTFFQFKEVIPLSFDKQKNPVHVAFDLVGANQVKFKSATHKCEITIDPTPELLYATYTKEDWGIEDVQFLNNMDYITLGYGDPVNIATEGAYQTTLQGTSNVILSRFSSSNVLIWSTYFGAGLTAGFEFVIVEDKIVFCGISNSTDLPTTDAFQPENAGGRDIIISVFSLDGNFEHCTYLGGQLDDSSNSITNLGNGKIAIGGRTNSSDFPVINSNTSFSGNTDAVVAVFDITNYSFLLSTIIGGSQTDFINDVIADNNGGLVFIGATNSASIDVIGEDALPPSLSQIFNGGSFDGLMGTIKSNMSLGFAGYLGSSGSENLRFGGRNSQDKNIIIGAHAGSITPFTADAQFTNLEGSSDGAVLFIFDNNFNIEYCSLLFQPWSFEFGNLVIDESDRIFVISETSSEVNIATGGAFQENLFIYPFSQIPSTDSFIFHLSPQGQKIWGTYFGNYAFQVGTAIDYKDSKLIIAGNTSSDASFPLEYQYSIVTNDAFSQQLTSSGGFIAVFDQLVSVTEPTASQKGLEVFPNPASETIYIIGHDNKGSRYYIYDLSGKVVASQLLNQSSINVASLTSGIYTLAIQSEASFYTIKFIKQ